MHFFCYFSWFCVISHQCVGFAAFLVVFCFGFFAFGLCGDY
ncbi:hypothetical protein MtrunA17_Chr1g0207721 [Medicago truncatula]|uniref:Transmembrane protein n=1 Tax=Medicago truncatula TaxID=3880 RepID=A0A396JXE8_MEDTR|nr:hypothetical protein MtrunA17_Chr1g0207721 [Medicago truncatula]